MADGGSGPIQICRLPSRDFAQRETDQDDDQNARCRYESNLNCGVKLDNPRLTLLYGP